MRNLKEDKDLLLKDLCARLSYDVKLSYRCNHTHVLRAVHKSGLIVINDTATDITTTTDVENIKPYLFPLSSMTEEQQLFYSTHLNYMPYYQRVDWFNKHHLDYRGIIPLGIAIDATGLDIYKS